MCIRDRDDIVDLSYFTVLFINRADFTHPAWRGELKEKLTPSEEGLYILRDYARISDQTVLGTKQTRYVVSGEISSIYKKNGKVRKVHNVILLPSLEDAAIFIFCRYQP